MQELITAENLFNLTLIICLAVGGLIAMRKGKQNTLATTQEQTINALQSRVAAMEGQLVDLQKENARQQFIIESIQAAMKAEGKLITINGEMIVISDENKKSSTTIRRRPTTPAPKNKSAKAESEDTK